MATRLFQPLLLDQLELQNRIIVSPMCQYSAENGCAHDWHIMHIGQFAMANPGLIMLEGTAVEANGRISEGDLCLFNDHQEAAIERLTQFVHNHSGSKLGMQLFHSGRKGSQRRPWDVDPDGNSGTTLSSKDGGWDCYAPSTQQFDKKYPMPIEASKDHLNRIKASFVNAAARAARAGIDTIELHYAHGYLLHSFLSEVSNHRTDEYGGEIENRMRFPLEVFEAVREVWPDHKPIGARVSGTDHGKAENAWKLEDALLFSRALTARGCDYIDVSSGYLSPNQDVPKDDPGFQVYLAKTIKQVVDVPVFSVGTIVSPKQAEQILDNGSADAVCLARAMLLDPRWVWRAAFELQEQPKFPPQYERAFMWGFQDTVERMRKGE